jgi:hypothetical protein
VLETTMATTSTHRHDESWNVGSRRFKSRSTHPNAFRIQTRSDESWNVYRIPRWQLKLFCRFNTSLLMNSSLIRLLNNDTMENYVQSFRLFSKSRTATSFKACVCCVHDKVKCFGSKGGKDRLIPLQAWKGPEASRRLRLPDSKTIGIWRW